MKKKNTKNLASRNIHPRVKKISLAVLLGFFIAHWTAAQMSQVEYYGPDANDRIPGASFVKQDHSADYPEFVRYAPGKEIPFQDFFSTLYGSRAFADHPQFTFIREQTDDLGIAHYRYVQSYLGVPIDKTHLTLHAKEGRVFAFDGHVRQTGQVNIQPGLNAEQALESAKKFVGASAYMWEDQKWESDLKSRKKDENATYYPKAQLILASSSASPHEVRLAYLLDISALSPMKDVRVCVDAVTGEILYDLPLESNCSPTTVNTVFNGVRAISTDFYDGVNFRLRDDCTPAEVYIRDWNSLTLTPNPIEIENTTNTWTSMNERFGGSTLWCVKQAYGYYLNRFSRDSYDDSNGDVSGLINALFNCAPPAGCTSANNASMSFTGGNLKVGLSSAGVLTNSYATVDILGHEFTHAVTGATAALDYEQESGALNESFSDIFGECIEAFVFGSHDWLMGSERDNGAIRNMSNPNANGDPDTYMGVNWVTIVPPCDGSNDQCGVHTNSGVQNFWFYLLTVGGTGNNDNGDDYEVSGIGLFDAEAIAYRNLVMYLGSTSDYSDARSGAIQASIDLFGLCSEQTRAVMDAWHAVGVGAAFLDVTATVTSDYNGADVSCFGASDGEATAQGTDGIPPYTYSWSNGIMGQVNTGLSAGTYFVTVTDLTGCTGTGAVTLTNPPMLSSTIAINSDYNGWPISCNGACDGIIEALPAGGTSPYTYDWSLSVGEQNTKEVSGLCAGLHRVTVTDANGCSVTADVTLSEPPPLEIEAGPNQTILYWNLSMACADLLATDATGGVPPYTYSWSSGGTDAAEHVCLEIWEDTITIVPYYITLTDANGCEAIDSLLVCYVDINCGKGNATKVEICHFPPDNPLNPHTLCVSLPALADHLLHGDALAACDFVSPCGADMPRIILPDYSALMEGAFGDQPVLNINPNPSSGYTEVQFLFHEDQNLVLQIVNMHGILVRTYEIGQVEAHEIYELEMELSGLPAGLYLTRLISAKSDISLYKVLMIQ